MDITSILQPYLQGQAARGGLAILLELDAAATREWTKPKAHLANENQLLHTDFVEL